MTVVLIYNVINILVHFFTNFEPTIKVHRPIIIVDNNTDQRVTVPKQFLYT